MKKKGMLLLCLILIVICIILIVQRIKLEEKTVNVDKLDLFDVISIDETRVEVTGNELDKERYINLANEQLSKLNLTIEKFEDSENTKISEYKNNREFLEEMCLSNEFMRVTIKKNTNELIQYSRTDINSKKNTFNEEQVREEAISIFNKLNMPIEYELLDLTEFDDEIYIAKFFKKYGEYTNRGEMVNISFTPEEEKVVGYVKKDINFANNEIKITEEQAKNIIKDYLKTEDEIEMTIKIVIPNIGAQPTLSHGKVYTSAKQTRLAYVCELNDEYRRIVYVDCTTGDVIGYDMLK